MKFFTFKWWSGCQGPDGSDDCLNEYPRHLASIRDRLPAPLLLLEESVSMHDGRLIELDLKATEGLLKMVVLGDDGQGGTRRFFLQYVGVRDFVSITNGLEGLPGPGGYGDLGYLETHLLDGGFQHRILFSSGIEIHISFESLEVHFKDGEPSPYH